MKYFIILLLAIFCVACGENSTAQKKVDPQYVFLGITPGVYTNCIYTGTASSYIKTKLTFTTTSLVSSVSLHVGSANCSAGLSWTATKAGSINYPNIKEDVSNFENTATVQANYINFSISSFEIINFNPTILAGWNAASICSKNDWVVSTSRDALNLMGCDLTGAGDIDEVTNGLAPNIYYMEGNNLVINAHISSAGSIQARPTDLKQMTLGSVRVTK